MKLLIKYILISMCLHPIISKAQLGVGTYLGSQYFTRKDEVLAKNYFSSGLELRLQGKRLFLRGTYRFLIPRTKKYDAVHYSNSNVATPTTLEVTYSETNMGLGLGCTFSRTKNLTRPYIMIGFLRGENETLYSFTQSDGYVAVAGKGTYNKRKYTREDYGVVFMSGFQFQIKSNICLSTDAYIFAQEGITLRDAEYFAIEIGLRFFVPKL